MSAEEGADHTTEISISMYSLHCCLPCVLWKENGDTNVPRLAIAAHGGSDPRALACSGAAGSGTSLQEGKYVSFLVFESKNQKSSRVICTAGCVLMACPAFGRGEISPAKP